jgi:tricorn protease
MNRIILGVLIQILLSNSSFGSTISPYFISDPTLSPDGSTVVFSYENDLWRVSADGGIAFRITAMDGKEWLPRFSPDGNWIAFTASQNGRENVFVMPASGGEIKQLTFHEATDNVDSWSWDSKWIYFSSDRYNLFSTYRISVSGGTPQRVFNHFFNNAHHTVPHPISNDYYFTDSWESFLFPHRKRYKGDHSPQILSYNKQSQKFTTHTNYQGKDMWPTIDSAGEVYFVSDEYNNEYNLYKFCNGEKVLLTKFDQSIKRPQVSANGSRVVFEKDYQLWIYVVETKTSKLVSISLNSNSTLELDQNFEVEAKITNFDVSPDGKMMAFVSRGELFVSDIKGKFVRKLDTNPNERVFEVFWTSDNRTLVFSESYKGWPNWFTISANGKEPEKQITFDEKTNRQMTLNTKRTQGVYLCGRDEVKILDFITLKTRTIVKDELWGFQNSSPYFSPDNEYVVFTAYRFFEQDIFIHHISSKKTINITNTGVTEGEPFWSPDGKYIYFTTDRYNPSYPRGMENSSIFRIPLYRFVSELKTEAFNNLFSEKPSVDTIPVVKIDLENIHERWEEVRVAGGQQYSPTLIRRKDEIIMLFASTHDKGELAIWKRVFKPYESPKTERLSSFVLRSEFQIAQAKSDLFVLANGNIHKANLEKNTLEKVEIKRSFSKQLRVEFNQMFFETWTILQENFYDEKFHGVNWLSKRDYYSSFLPYFRNRDNLRVLLNDMLGELNASHMGFRSTGNEEKAYFSAHTASIGVMFDNENPYRVSKVLSKSNIDITQPLIQSGDILVAVNGKRVEPLHNRESYFSLPSRMDELSLTFLRNGKEISVVVPTHSSAQIFDMLYDEWITENRKYIAKKSNGRIGYVHMKDMSVNSLNQFIIDMTTHAERTEALIFDLRYNRGGNVHNDVLQFLSQKQYLQWKYREGMLSPQPNFSPSSKPMILVMNEQSLSDAEMTAAGFRQLKLGKLLGTETYRWIIFTSGKGLVDGSFVRVPAWGCYTLDGENLELTGVVPDIYIKTTFKDRLNNVDPQIDMAIEEMLKEL